MSTILRRLVKLKCFLLLMLFVSQPAWAKLQVVTTTTSLAWVVQQVAKDVEVTALVSPSQDPHYLDASPKFILKVAQADVVCFNGLQLESGWLPKVLQKSGNARVQSGGKGYCDAGASVQAIDIPAEKVDRSQGHIHPAGNPHYSLSPTHLAQAADAVAQALIRVNPERSEVYQTNLNSLKARLVKIQEKMTGQLKERFAEGLPPVMQYHQGFDYFFEAYSVPQAGSLEAVPGVPPSASHLAKAAIEAKNKNVRLALAASYNRESVLQRFTQMSGIPYKQVLTHVKHPANPGAYESLQKQVIQAIIDASPSTDKQ